MKIYEPGGPEAFRWEEITLPAPGPGEIQIRQTAIGVNFIDVYHRSGLYPLPQLPAVIGTEGCGEVTAVGVGVEEFRPGDRVAYVGGPLGAYTEARNLAARHAVMIPSRLSDARAAGILLKGLTARFLVKYSYPVQKGSTVLVHAAAGGVGLLLCQWAKLLGATVIGAVSSEEKAALARSNGCDHTLLAGRDDIAARVMELTGGIGVNVAYDSVGRETLQASLDSLMDLGVLVSFGQSSGPIPPFDIGRLRPKSLYLQRPQLFTYIADPEQYAIAAAEVFDLTLSGKLKMHILQTYYLSQAADAHRALEARQTKGSTVLITGDDALKERF